MSNLMNTISTTSSKKRKVLLTDSSQPKCSTCCTFRFLQSTILSAVGLWVGFLLISNHYVVHKVIPSSNTKEKNNNNKIIISTKKVQTTKEPIIIWKPNHKLPRRFFAFPNASAFYAEPTSNSNDGDYYYENISRYPYNIPDLIPMNATNPNVISIIQQTVQQRFHALIQSDATIPNTASRPKYLPPQFPQRDRSVSSSLLQSTTNTSYIIGFPPTCCPLKKLSDGSLVENTQGDCTCRTTTNYPNDGIWPKVTLVSAFYQFSSKHNSDAYKRYMRQTLQSSDPLVIFLEPNSEEWITYIRQQRQHAPTIIVLRSAKDMVCATAFSIDQFWQDQHQRLNPERESHHKGVSMYLYAIWCEKILLVEAVARLNPFNTTTFAWMDAGIARNPMPHLWRHSIVHTNISTAVDDHAVLFQQVWKYDFQEEQAYNPITPTKQLVAVGSMFVGTLAGFDNLYSAYYDVLWSMALEDLFIGEDQCVLYRTCHTYPSACHIHSGGRMYQFNAFIKENEVLHGTNAKISDPLQLTPIEPRPIALPVPPLTVTKENILPLHAAITNASLSS